SARSFLDPQARIRWGSRSDIRPFGYCIIRCAFGASTSASCPLKGYGVPFSFIPCAGAGSDPKPGPIPTRVRALEERTDREITFPRLLGYRYDLPEARLEVKFTADSRLTLSAADLPTKTENAPIIGESVVHDLQELRNRREQEVAFQLAKLTLEKYF